MTENAWKSIIIESEIIIEWDFISKVRRKDDDNSTICEWTEFSVELFTRFPEIFNIFTLEEGNTENI